MLSEFPERPKSLIPLIVWLVLVVGIKETILLAIVTLAGFPELPKKLIPVHVLVEPTTVVW